MELGRLEAVGIREVWESEPRDFTPWLLDHADYLADALGIDLELERSEHPVGDFALDLIGSDLSNDAVLIVENQLESTDHTHLGQILTYAAGTDASTIVWIAASFRDEHRQAIDWLNEQTRENIHFFGIEIGVVQIGDSEKAPLFTLVAEPNNWQKQVRSSRGAGRIGTKSALYQSFWERHLVRLREEHPDWSHARSAANRSFMGFPSPLKGTRLKLSFASGKRLRHEIYIDTGDKNLNKTAFATFHEQREAFEAAYGRTLEWEELPDARASRIADYRDDGDVAYEDQHDQYSEWFLDAGARMRRALAAIELPDT